MRDFLNRRPHLDRLAQLLRSQAPTARLILVTGGTGVGKSALVRQAAQACSDRYLYVGCDRAAGASPDGTPAPELLEHQLSALAPGHGFKTFVQFTSEHRWSKTLKRGSEALASIATKALLPSAASDFAWESYERIKKEQVKTRPVPPPTGRDLDDLRLVYIQSVLRSTPAIVHFDHAHMLGHAEVRILSHLVDTTDDVFFFVECSTDQTEPLVTAAPGLQIKVEPLALEYAERLFATLPTRFVAPLRAGFSKSGNLRLFEAGPMPSEQRPSRTTYAWR